MNGLSLDDVWNNIVATIGGLDAQADETIQEQILNREQQEKLLQKFDIQVDVSLLFRGSICLQVFLSMVQGGQVRFWDDRKARQ